MTELVFKRALTKIKARELRSQGKSYAEISRMCGIVPACARNYTVSIPFVPLLSDEDVKKAKEMRESGMTYESIAEIFKVSAALIRGRLVYKYGVVERKKNGVRS